MKIRYHAILFLLIILTSCSEDEGSFFVDSQDAKPVASLLYPINHGVYDIDDLDSILAICKDLDGNIKSAKIIFENVEVLGEIDSSSYVKFPWSDFTIESDTQKINTMILEVTDESGNFKRDSSRFIVGDIDPLDTLLLSSIQDSIVTIKWHKEGIDSVIIIKEFYADTMFIDSIDFSLETFGGANIDSIIDTLSSGIYRYYSQTTKKINNKFLPITSERSSALYKHQNFIPQAKILFPTSDLSFSNIDSTISIKYQFSDYDGKIDSAFLYVDNTLIKKHYGNVDSIITTEYAINETFIGKLLLLKLEVTDNHGSIVEKKVYIKILK